MKQSGKAQEPTQLNQEHSDDAIWVSILEQVGEGVIVADASGQITFVNEAAKRIHGVAELGVGVENWTETYHLLTMEGGDYPPQELPLARALLQREVVRDALWRIRRPDGSIVTPASPAELAAAAATTSP
ncbi:MAG: PAS domain-containing protein [Verrucomicrobiaceae bacterium]|nr:MAG: PAS domain-containing protein [Verrucomicrobiaceae bacterium]